MRRMYSKNQVEEFVKNTKKDIATLVDSDGHNRFIEDDITMETIEGITQTYCKWSLSGTHLMIVVCGNIADTTALTENQLLSAVSLPDWVKEKIVPIRPNTQEVILTQFLAYGAGGTTQNLSVRLVKTNENVIQIKKTGNLTLTADRSFRISFDLLIDSD